MSTCFRENNTTPRFISKGVTLWKLRESTLSGEMTHIAYSDGTHLNVMAYMATAYVIDDPSTNTTHRVSIAAPKLIETRVCQGFEGSVWTVRRKTQPSSRCWPQQERCNKGMRQKWYSICAGAAYDSLCLRNTHLHQHKRIRHRIRVPSH